jgi:hypothetical protein
VLKLCVQGDEFRGGASRHFGDFIGKNGQSEFSEGSRENPRAVGSCRGARKLPRSKEEF